jgi:hypothetical protein
MLIKCSCGRGRESGIERAVAVQEYYVGGLRPTTQYFSNAFIARPSCRKRTAKVEFDQRHFELCCQSRAFVG